MPLPMPLDQDATVILSAMAEYPVASREATAYVDGIPTTATRYSFTDKIMITISQEGKLAQWVSVL